jgi:phosphoenolpyruvate phosphomutase
MPNYGDHMSKTRQLGEMLLSDELAFIMEAHDGISSKIVEEAGFKGIWASGLSMSAALGVRDSNEASWTQVLDVLEFMSDATTIPILVDGDTGYGNFNNMRRAVQKLCQRNIAGICIEDKLFPKTNSFIGDGQPLADIDEFCGKIKAGKDSQLDDDFSVIARVEALISGWGMAEALKRAGAYHEAGADGILIHSKMRDAEEILEFLREWDRRCPVVIVPTTYYQTPTEAFQEAGASLVIWANHNIRAGISAMREVSRRIHRDQSLMGVEDKIASVADIFELAENAELAEAEKIYLPASEPEVNAVILAASRGSKLGDLTKDIPKCMIDIRGQPLLRRLTTTLNQSRVRNITVVRGHKKETVNLPSLDFVDNDAFDQTGEAVSLNQARDALKGPTILAYGDILFRQHILDDLLEVDGDIVLVADALWRDKDPDPASRLRDLVSCSEPHNMGYLGSDDVALTTIGADVAESEIHGEWIGLSKVSATGAAAITAELDKIESEGALATSSLIDVFQRLCASGTEIRVHYVTGHWLDVDNAADLAEALKFL